MGLEPTYFGIVLGGGRGGPWYAGHTCSLLTSAISPLFKPMWPCIAATKRSSANDVFIVDSFDLLFTHLLRNLNPKTILCKSMAKVFLMEIDDVSFKLQVKKAHDAYSFAVIRLRVGYELNQTDVINSSVGATLRIISRHLGVPVGNWDYEQKGEREHE
jgi:hypothetical protein